jgi:excisionase family DNA binding protein
MDLFIINRQKLTVEHTRTGGLKVKKLFTPREIATILQVVPATIYAELERGKLPHRRVGRRYIITRKHLETYLSREVAVELLGSEESGPPLDSQEVRQPLHDEGSTWLDSAALEMARGIATAEEGTPKQEHEAWLNAVTAAVKPLPAEEV